MPHIKTTADTADFLHRFGTTEATLERNVKKRMLEMLIEEIARHRLDRILHNELVAYETVEGED